MVSLAFAWILTNRLTFYKLELIIQVSLFLVVIASGNENIFLGRGWMGGLTKDADLPGSGSAVIKYTETAKDN